jgi:glycosyltransferase involved in cell wall biosynthesis
MPEVRARFPNARLVLAGANDMGGDPAYERRVLDEAASLGDVVVLGAVPEAARLMPWFDAVAVPSHSEGFSMVAVEALAAGTPVAATRSGGMEEYLEHGRSGMLVPPGDQRELAQALSVLLERGESMATAARAAAASFATPLVADRVAAALREALG